jgi:DNA phosphorothioation-associated putative methyltransferase
MITRPEKTAISRNDLSVPATKMLQLGLIKKDQFILDYGCGKGGDLRRLRNLGYNVFGYDRFILDFKDEDLIETWRYDVIYSFYVLNVIEDGFFRWYAVEKMKKLADKIIIAVRADKKAVRESWTEYNDGYITSNNTFQCFYTENKIYNDFSCHDFNLTILESNSSYIMFQLERSK